ncbi:DUF1648 domain-containing protein [Tissierella sp. MSJ-40]|uniref:DUF1648 domain-containing protein n=1 Tax=Tissierella simiarum TaxID=2841534 RepID=A0ABS6EB79_9FIRM|nr:DUF1648 domain-containing protein [Tissierella simiarum]MBU5440189.1 DUF1648 domain-containing protein [Tissierella simiarum]
MTEKLIWVLFNSLILLFILITQILTPKTTRKNILFGVKVPEEVLEDEEIKRLFKGFKRDNLIIGIPILFIISLLLYYSSNVILLVFLIFVYMAILFLIYLKWNKKSKELKIEKGWDKIGGKIVMVDMRYSRDKKSRGIVSPIWFLVPIGIILFNIILVFVLYPTLPNKIPTHWNFQGNVSEYKDKSISTLLMMPLTQISMAIAIYFTYFIIGRSKQQINPNSPEESLKRNILFRKAWSMYLIGMLTLLELLFTFINMVSLGVLRINMGIFNFIILGISGIIIIGTIVLAVKIGQGGERLKLREDKVIETIHDRDDDNLWKLGNTIYYNPDDSSLFVEKRFGVGWTVNAGRPLGMFLMILPIIIVVITIILVK